MAKNLVIVESPAKAKTINKMLGKDYIVLASMGHVRDLPEHSLGVDVDKGFEPRYEPIKSRAKTISNLVSQAAKAETVYLAPDPDREGEAIAWHLRELLKKKGDKAGKFRRVTYNEITASAIKRAFAAPGEIDMPRVDSQQARRILDRLVGYKVSPSLRRAIPGASSAGRVQSVALRLVCEREKAIRDFVPEPYWILGVRAAKQTPPTAPFTARLARIDGKKADIRDAAEAERLSAELRRRGLRVAAVLNKEVRRNAPPPFITSTLQQAASGALGYAPARTMKIAQKLYEGVDIGGGSGTTGLITYMRTDSVAVAAEAASAARACIERLYGPDFLPPAPPVYRSRSSAQEAHEAIRPTDPARTPDSLKGILDPDDWRLYDLVWRRFTASQMAPARIAQRTAEIEAVPLPGAPASPDTFLFRATVSEIAFPGFMRASGLEQRKRAAAPARAPDGREEESDEVDSLPPLAEGETLDPVEWLSDRKETQPPPRYTDASLVKALEENGVGRPSTYAQTIATLLDRKYADHDKRALVPTDLGMKACDYLVQHLSSLFDVQFTAAMEEQLDRVEEKQASWRDMLTDFYARFRTWLAALRGPEADTAAVDRLLAAFAHVTDWNPPVKRGARTYSDEKFVKSIRDQRESGERPLTARQQTALATVFQRYRDRIPGADAIAAELSLPDAPATAAPEVPRAAGTPAEAPAAPAASDAATAEKLALLANVTFSPPRKFGKRTYDDAAFCASLREQAQSGRALSPAQVGYLDKLLLKYAPQIPDFDQKRDALGLAAAPAPAAAAQLDALVSLFDTVTDWRPPTAGIRGRTWDDRDFYTSLRDQYRQSKTLSFKQVSALKRLASAYASQIPDYPAKAQALGLPPPRAPKAPKAPKDSKDPRP